MVACLSFLLALGNILSLKADLHSCGVNKKLIAMATIIIVGISGSRNTNKLLI